jgi:hypothetical protein
MVTEASTSIKRLYALEDYFRHCEERSDEAIHIALCGAHGLLRGTCHRAALCADPLARNDAKKAWRFALAVTVFIRYQLDPFKRAMFEEYARRWLSVIPKCGGDLVGYWMPHEGTNNIAFALTSFENLAAYENYRARLRADDEGMANFGFAEENKFILAEERTFLRKVTL